MRNSRFFGLWLTLALLLTTAQLSQSQTSQKGSRSEAEPAQAEAISPQEKPPSKLEAAGLRAGTKIAAELVSTVDAHTAKPGDEVVARAVKDVKQDGRKMIQKGDRLIGRITSVEAGVAADAASRLAVTFDRLVSGKATSQLNAVVSAVLSTPTEERAQRQPMMEPEPMMAPPAPAPAPAPAPGPSSGSTPAGGGLLGGVTSTAGSTVGAAGSTLGGVTSAVNSSATATGSAAGNVGGVPDASGRATAGGASGATLATPLRAIRVDSQAQGEQQAAAGSVFSTRQGHLRMESGTRLQFRVAGQAESRSQNK